VTASFEKPPAIRRVHSVTVTGTDIERALAPSNLEPASVPVAEGKRRTEQT